MDSHAILDHRTINAEKLAISCCTSLLYVFDVVIWNKKKILSYIIETYLILNCIIQKLFLIF